MPWAEMATEAWVETVSAEIVQLKDPVGLSLARFELLPREFEGRGAIHYGTLRINGDFVPPSQITAIFGDLEVSGRISTQGVDGADGNTTLLVLGSVESSTLVNDWSSLILVSEDVVVREWALMDQEDSSFVAGANFVTPLFLGYDIWATVGGAASMEAGIGYAVKIDMNGRENFDHVFRPNLSKDETERMLRISDSQQLFERFYNTGTILPSD
ncbi:hypothetical protein L0F51_16095 [Afifella sp. H1R]|uniref:hypothetical protein n=1 Tax=Afifella sp. H1R TaxID=2908841 RepID=UPI001F350202|nr:hypothetical protein [Afifella sp. H1R]MCF1505274.1 hypothetical protein [Afifella sp. H1R]